MYKQNLYFKEKLPIKINSDLSQTDIVTMDIGTNNHPHITVDQYHIQNSIEY